MSFNIKYRELFRQKIVHKYFLDKGLNSYEAMTESEQRKQLENYNISSFLKIMPAPETASVLSGHGLVFKTRNDGFSIFAKVSSENPLKTFIPISDQLELTFIVKLAEPFFYNYTDLNFETADEVFCFSNISPDSSVPDFPLIDQAGGTAWVDENFVLFSKNEKPDADDNILIKRLKNIAIQENSDLLGFFHIAMKGSNESLNIIDSDGNLSDPVKIFEIVFQNRESKWRYIFSDDQLISADDDLEIENEDDNKKTLITKISYPLTQHGFIPVRLNGRELPNPGSALVKPDKTTQIVYSEIYM